MLLCANQIQKRPECQLTNFWWYMDWFICIVLLMPLGRHSDPTCILILRHHGSCEATWLTRRLEQRTVGIFEGNSIRRRQWQPTPVLLPGKSHGQRSLVGYSPWSCDEWHTTERLHFHFSLSCIGEGNGNPLQYSSRENPRDGRACWAAVYGVAQSRTQLKRLSSSSSSRP